MAKVRYKTDKELELESKLYGSVQGIKYYICDSCSERSSVKTSDGEHYCIEHYLAKVDKEMANV